MAWQSIAPVERAEKPAGISAFTANEPGSRQGKTGHAPNGRSQKETIMRKPDPNRISASSEFRHDGEGDSTPDFQTLLKRVSDDNYSLKEKMRGSEAQAPVVVPYANAEILSFMLKFELARMSRDH